MSAMHGVGLRMAAVAAVGSLVVVGVPGAWSTPASSAATWANHDADAWQGWQAPANLLTDPTGCDPIDPAQCLLPYPNDYFTRPDPTSATGRRLDLNLLAMPSNALGKPIDPTAWNQSDGFSAGAQILTVVPGMTSNADLAPSGLPSDTDMALNKDRGALGVLLLDTTTGKTWPVWAEVDQYTEEDGVVPAGAVGSIQQDLMIHPAANLLDGHRYIVALRHIVTDAGTPAQPSGAFASYVSDYVDHSATSDPRAAHMDGVLADVAEAGWDPSSLYLAWDFTTASTANVTGRLLAIRDDAFAQLGQTKADMAAGRITPGSRAPSFTVQSVTNYSPTPGTADYNALVARQITGTFTVPCYIAPTCSPPVKCADTWSTVTAGLPAAVAAKLPGSPFDDCPSPGVFLLGPGPDAVPQQVAGQSYQAKFICNVGYRTLRDHRLARPVEYGHGLFGSASEVSADPQEQMVARYGMMYCATDWFGFANSDVPNAVLALSDLSNFPILADRTQQGELDFLYLQRLLRSAGGFASDPAFQWSDGAFAGKTFVDTRAVYYDGNSQGGIYGGTVCAVSIDVRRCALGVPGMDYAVLLPRSSDFVATQPLSQTNPSTVSATDPTGAIGYSQVFDLFYPDQAQRMLLLDLIQTLWDRADPNGYATHMTASAMGGLLPDTPNHTVLLQAAWGDHQVADITAEDEARTIGARGIEPAILGTRLSGTNDPAGPYSYDPASILYGVAPVSSLPYAGSAIAFFDGGPPGASPYGTDPPPPSDVPNRSGADPHEAPRRSCAAQAMKSAFLAPGGAVTEPSQSPGPAAPPYFSGGWRGTCSD